MTTTSGGFSGGEDEVAPRRYSREALIQIRASPRASARGSTEAPTTTGGGGGGGGGVGGRGGSDDDILGLGNLFLPRASAGGGGAAPILAPNFDAAVGFSSVAPMAGNNRILPTEFEGGASNNPSSASARPSSLSQQQQQQQRHHQTNLSLTDDIKSALRIGETDSATAAARAAAMAAAMDAASAASASTMLRHLEQQQQRQQQSRTASLGLSSSASRMMAPSLGSQSLGPRLPVARYSGAGLPTPPNPGGANLPPDVTPPPQ